MEMFKSSLTRQPRKFADVAKNQARIRAVATQSQSRVFTQFAYSFAKVVGLGESLQRIAQREFGYEIVLPPPPIGGAEVAAGLHGAPLAVLEERLDDYIEQLEERVRACSYFGRVESLGNRALRFSYYEPTRQTGLFEHTYTMTRIVHDLVDAKERKLTDPDVNLPRREDRLVHMLPVDVLPDVRVIVGMLVQVDQTDAGTERREHAFGRRFWQFRAAADRRRQDVSAPRTASGQAR